MGRGREPKPLKLKKTGNTRGGRSVAFTRLLIALLILGTGAVAAVRLMPESKPAGNGRIAVELVRVADGDTIEVRSHDGKDIRVRLIGIDSEELGTAESFRAAAFAAELLERAAHIEIEPEPTGSEDKYGRSLSWVWVTVGGSELLLQEELVREGHAELFRKAEGSKYYKRLINAQSVLRSP